MLTGSIPRGVTRIGWKEGGAMVPCEVCNEQYSIFNTWAGNSMTTDHLPSFGDVSYNISDMSSPNPCPSPFSIKLPGTLMRV